LIKEKKKIVSSAVKKVRFADKVQKERMANKDAAAAQVSADKLAVKRAIAADRRAVQRARKKRIAVQKRAIVKMANAKEAWEAHAIKKKQAEKAALEGRHQGDREGADEARRKVKAWEDATVKAAQARKRADATAAAAKKAAEERKAIDDVTAEKAEADRAYSERAAAAARAVKAHAAAAAHWAEDRILGAEGMKDTMIAHDAEQVAEKLHRRTHSDQHRIDEAASANWPESSLQTQSTVKLGSEGTHATQKLKGCMKSLCNFEDRVWDIGALPFACLLGPGHCTGCPEYAEKCPGCPCEGGEDGLGTEPMKREEEDDEEVIPRRAPPTPEVQGKPKGCLTSLCQWSTPDDGGKPYGCRLPPGNCDGCEQYARKCLN